MRLRSMLASAAIILMPALAHAEIKVDSAKYAGGILVVRGVAPEANMTVTLNGRYTKKSFGNKRFLFRLTLKPRNCSVHVTAGTEEARAPIEGCKPLN